MQSAISATTTIITRTRTDVTVRQSTEKHSSKAKGCTYSILTSEKLAKIEARRKELVALIAALPQSPKKLQERLTYWEEWSSLSKKKYKHTILKLEEKIKTLESKIVDLENDAGLDELRYKEQAEKLKQSETAASDLSTRLTEQIEQKKALQSQVNKLSVTVNEAKRQTKFLQGDVELIRDRRDELREFLEQEKVSYRKQKEEWQAYTDQLLKEIISHSDQQQKLQAENIDLKSRLAAREKETGAKEAQVGQLNKELEDARAERDRLMQSHADLSAESAAKRVRIETQDGEIQALRAKVASLMQANDDLQVGLRGEQEAKKASAKRAKTETKDPDIQALEARIANLEKDCKDERDAKDAATRRVGELLNANTKLSEQHLSKENDRLVQANDSLVQANTELRQENIELRRVNKELQKDTDSTGAASKVNKKRKGPTSRASGV